MNQVYVKAGDNRKARHPETGQPVPPEGAYWPDGPYLKRRLRDGDIIVARIPHARRKGVKK